METSFRSTTDWVRQRDNRRKPANPPAAANRRSSRKRRESRLRQATDPRRTEWLDTRESADGKRVLKHRPYSLHFNSEIRRRIESSKAFGTSVTRYSSALDKSFPGKRILRFGPD